MRGHFEDLGIEKKMILKKDLQEIDWETWTEFKGPKIGGRTL